MENHPIPQDVTGFQFKLIGDMTVKQFAYLASGCVLAWICYSITLGALVKFPLILIFAGTGAAFAFLPIEGRPLDTMLFNFGKALFIPNQYLYQKTGGSLSAYFPAPKTKTQSPSQTSSSQRLELFINQLPKRSKNKLDEKETAYFLHLSQMYAGTAAAPADQPQVMTMTADQPSPQPQAQQEEILIEQSQTLQKQLEAAKAQEQKPAPGHEQEAHEKVLELEAQLSNIMSQKQALEQQLMALSQKLAQKNQQVFVPSQGGGTAMGKGPLEESANIKTVSKGMGAQVGLPIVSENPNLVVGIVKDARGNILPNILVEIKDIEGNPVRAFKTNQLGQFASATALLNGAYTMTFEDPLERNTFDAVRIQASGQIIQPLEITSTDAREELRKQLFG